MLRPARLAFAVRPAASTSCALKRYELIASASGTSRIRHLDIFEAGHEPLAGVEQRLPVGECFLMREQNALVRDRNHVIVKRARCNGFLGLLGKDDARRIESVQPCDRF